MIYPTIKAHAAGTCVRNKPGNVVKQEGVGDDFAALLSG